MFPPQCFPFGFHSSLSERRLAYARGGGERQQQQPRNEYLEGVGEGLRSSPDRYFHEEGEKRSNYSQRRLDDFRALSRGGERQLYFIDENTRPQQQSLQEAAWMHRKYSLAIQRASARDRRLGRRGMTYPGAEVMMNRGMMGVQHHGQNLYGLDAMRRQVFDRKSYYDAHYATEKRYPLSGPSQNYRRDEQDEEQGPRRGEQREEGAREEESFDAPRSPRSVRQAASEGGEEEGAFGGTTERSQEAMPSVIRQLMLVIQQLTQAIAGMKKESRAESTTLSAETKAKIKDYVMKTQNSDSTASAALKELKNEYRSADESGRIVIGIAIVKQFKEQKRESNVSIGDDDFTVKLGKQLS